MSTKARFTANLTPIEQGTDNTDRIKTNQYLVPAFATPLALKTYCANTLVNLALTGAITINIGVGDANNPPFVGDTVELLLTPDGTTRVVTFGTGFAPTAATFSVTTAKYGRAAFQFNGVAWIETGRSISA